MIDRRTMLVGPAAMVSLRARAAETPRDQQGAGIPVTLRPDASPLSGSKVAPAGKLELAAAGGEPVLTLQAHKDAILRFGNDTAKRTGFAFVGLRGWGAADAPAALAIASIDPGERHNCGLRPPDSGTALIRAAPSSNNEAGRGAVAVLLVEDAAPVDVDDDRAILVQDWLLGADGQLRFGSTPPPPDAVERVVTVNRRATPEKVVLPPRARVRLRLVNGSTQRVMLIACEGMMSAVVAIDGQPCALFTPARGMVPVGPGARFDLMADLPDAPGQEARVVLRGTETLAGALEPDRTLLILRTDGPAREKRPPMAALPSNPALPTAIPLEAARRLDLVFAGGTGPQATWTINAATTVTTPLLTVRRGDAVTLGLINSSPVLVPIRVQGQVMRVLHAKDDGWDPYWRDSVLLPPRTTTHVAFVADSPGRWAVESGFDDQLLGGLRCWFAVTPR